MVRILSAAHSIASVFSESAAGFHLKSRMCDMCKVSSLDTQVAPNDPFLSLRNFAPFMNHTLFAMAM
jgi:hypothetical protein